MIPNEGLQILRKLLIHYFNKFSSNCCKYNDIVLFLPMWWPFLIIAYYFMHGKGRSEEISKKEEKNGNFRKMSATLDRNQKWKKSRNDRRNQNWNKNPTPVI